MQVYVLQSNLPSSGFSVAASEMLSVNFAKQNNKKNLNVI